jgi:hypothetical protein
MASHVSYKFLAERVRVAVVMTDGKLAPRWFDLPDRRITVKEVNYRWEYCKGAARILCYSTWDGCNAYTLEFNTRNFTWWLGVSDYSPV